MFHIFLPGHMSHHNHNHISDYNREPRVESFRYELYGLILWFLSLSGIFQHSFSLIDVDKVTSAWSVVLTALLGGLPLHCRMLATDGGDIGLNSSMSTSTTSSPFSPLELPSTFWTSSAWLEFPLSSKIGCQCPSVSDFFETGFSVDVHTMAIHSWLALQISTIWLCHTAPVLMCSNR